METRVDKYLWSIRVFKTRSDAAEACRTGKVNVNGTEAKPSKDIREGDMIEVRKGPVHYMYRVIIPIDRRQSAADVPIYAENLTSQEELSKLDRPVETIFMKRDRGTGRPTKKERRVLDRMMEDLM